MPESARQLEEARSLAAALLGVVRELADSYGDLGEINPQLEWERLPYWLTRETGAPDGWERDDAAGES